MKLVLKLLLEFLAGEGITDYHITDEGNLTVAKAEIKADEPHMLKLLVAISEKNVYVLTAAVNLEDQNVHGGEDIVFESFQVLN